MAFLQTTAASISSGGTINGDLTISGDLTVSGSGSYAYSEVLTGDIKITNAFASDSVAADDATSLHIDFDRATQDSGTAAHNDIGINLDVSSSSKGTSTAIGMDIDVVGAGTGTQTATGLTVDVSGGNTNYAALFNGGNVGIGTASPDSTLEISHASAPFFKVTETGNAVETIMKSTSVGGFVGTITDDEFRILTYDATKMTVLSNGNVGIGQTNPSDAKLSISGVLAGDYGIKLAQERNVSSIFISSDANTAHCIDISSPANTSGNIINIASADTLTTGAAISIDAGGTSLASTAAGGLVEVMYDGAGTGTNNLLFIKNDSATAVNTTALKIQQDSTGASIDAGGYMVNEQGRQNHVANTMSSPYYRFDGVDDFIACGDDTDLDITGEISLSAWVLFDAIESDAQFVMGRDDDSSRNYYLAISSAGKIESVFFGLSDTTLQGNTTLTIGTWNHIVATYDGATKTVYLNGVADGSESATGTIDNDNVSFSIGAREAGVDRFFGGQISDVKLFNNALTAPEVKEFYSGASVPFKYKGASGTAKYTSDFSGGVDSWAEGVRAAVAGNVDSIGSENDWLRTTLPTAAGSHYIVNTGIEQTDGKRYKLSIKYFIPSGQSNLDGFIIYNHAGNLIDNLAPSATLGSTTTATLEYTAATSTNGIRIVWTDGGAVTFTDSGGDDVGYVKDIVVTQIGAVAEYDGSGAGVHRWGDKSGNALHGTVGDGAGGSTAPTLENTPYDSGTEYEEGTWTPLLSDGTNTNATYSTQVGTYTKIGNKVHVQGRLTTNSSLGSVSGNVKIAGLPFTAQDVTDDYSSATFGFAGGLAITAGTTVTGSIETCATVIVMRVWSATTGTSNLTHTQWSVDGDIVFSADYIAE